MDYLMKLCREQGIRLIYTDNDDIILSAEVINRAPILKVFRKFSECPEEVAQAIIEYYTKKKKAFLDLIENYIEDSLLFLGYAIEPPNDTFLSIVKDYHVTDLKPKPVSDEKPPDMEEVDILSITCTDFDGNIYKLTPDKSIRTPDESIKEFNITIKTK